MEYCDILALSVLAFGFDTCFLSLSISFLLAKSTKTMQNELFKKVKYECTTMRELQFHLVFGFIDFVEHTQTGHNQNNRSLRGEEQVYVQCKYCHWQRLFTSIYEYLLRFCIESVPISVYIFLALFPFLIESIAIKCIFSHYVSYILCFVSPDERRFGYSVFTLFHEVATLLSVIWFPFSHTCRRQKKKITQQNKTTAPKANGI